MMQLVLMVYSAEVVNDEVKFSPLFFMLLTKHISHLMCFTKLTLLRGMNIHNCHRTSK